MRAIQQERKKKQYWLKLSDFVGGFHLIFTHIKCYRAKCDKFHDYSTKISHKKKQKQLRGNTIFYRNFIFLVQEK